jgi:hypothetical protein
LQDVEWGFSFDVHLNAFFPILVILHFVQLFVYHIFIGGSLTVKLDALFRVLGGFILGAFNKAFFLPKNVHQISFS